MSVVALDSDGKEIYKKCAYCFGTSFFLDVLIAFDVVAAKAS